MIKKLLSVQQLSIGYKTKALGQNLSFDVYEKEILCLLGPNGSGKTTLFKTILGLLPALAGQVQIAEQHLHHLSRRELAQLVAYVPQATEGVFAFTVLDMVLMGRNAYVGIFQTPSRVDVELAMHCLSQLGIDALFDRHYTELSGGEKQLVLLARALVQEPRILILDEPTASLDFGNQVRVLNQIQALRQQGLAVFMCTHQPEHAHRIADRVMLFKKGQIISQGATCNTLTMTALADLYDLPMKVVQTHLQHHML